MTNLESLRSLQKGIREATGPDRDLDHAILLALLPRTRTDLITYGTPFTADPDGLGPCVALMRAALPGCRWTKTASGRYRIWSDDADRVLEAEPLGILSDADPRANDCLTFLDAIFSAAIAQEKAKEKAG